MASPPPPCPLFIMRKAKQKRLQSWLAPIESTSGVIEDVLKCFLTGLFEGLTGDFCKCQQQ